MQIKMAPVESQVMHAIQSPSQMTRIRHAQQAHHESSNHLLEHLHQNVTAVYRPSICTLTLFHLLR
jgi:hypothetical protein